MQRVQSLEVRKEHLAIALSHLDTRDVTRVNKACWGKRKSTVSGVSARKPTDHVQTTERPHLTSAMKRAKAIKTEHWWASKKNKKNIYIFQEDADGLCIVEHLAWVIRHLDA